MDYYVRMVERDTQETVKDFGPMSLRRAEKLRDGMGANLNHEEFMIVLESF